MPFKEHRYRRIEYELNKRCARIIAKMRNLLDDTKENINK